MLIINPLNDGIAGESNTITMASFNLNFILRVVVTGLHPLSTWFLIVRHLSFNLPYETHLRELLSLLGIFDWCPARIPLGDSLPLEF